MSPELAGTQPKIEDQPVLDGRPLPMLSLRLNFIWTFLGNTVYAASQWGVLVLLAKLTSPEVVGQFALGLAVTAPLMMLANLNLRAVQATDAKNEFRFGDYLGLRLVTTALAMAAIVVAVLAVGYRREVGLLIIVIGMAKAFEAVSDIVFGLLQRHERMDRIAISMSIKGPLSLLALGVLMWLTGNILIGTVGMAIIWLGMLLLYDLRNAHFLSTVNPIFSGSTLWRLTKLSLPLGIVMMLVSLSTNIPRYFIERLQGEQQLGYFAAMAYLMVVGNTVVGALGQSASPRLAKHYANSDRAAFQGLLIKVVGVGTALGLAGVSLALLFGSQILSVLYEPEYAIYSDVLIWLMFAAAFSYVASFLGYSMTAARYFRVQLPLFVLVVLILTCACAVLVPVNGILGAAQAMVIAAAVQLVGALGVNAYALRSLSRRASLEGAGCV